MRPQTLAVCIAALVLPTAALAICELPTIEEPEFDEAPPSTGWTPLIGPEWEDADIVDDLNADDQIVFSSPKIAADLYKEEPPVLYQDQFGFFLNDIWAAEGDGSNPHRITALPYSVNHFVISEDRKLLIASIWNRGDTGGGPDDPETEGYIANGRLDDADWKTVLLIDLEHGRQTPIAFVGTTELLSGNGGVAFGPASGNGDRKVYFGANVPNQSVSEIYTVELTATSDPDEPYAIGEAVPITGTLNQKVGYGGSETWKWVSDIDVSADGLTMSMLYLGPDMLLQDQSEWRSRIVVAKTDMSRAVIATSGGNDEWHLPGEPALGRLRFRSLRRRRRARYPALQRERE